ncbi:MAG: hypothetical protein A2033_10885 [Bacteroidetes bacterium GWA2_31_9]|nr:MAG: hypothetical protein A2033_10885 [Bacteroidetes bacterium GWA2_31_9]
MAVCDIINIKYASKALVESCKFIGNDKFDTDAIDYDGISKGKIINNHITGFFGFNSDGIDIGEQASDILIKDNFISNCNDKGISIGQASSAIIENNIIVNCGTGIAIKDTLSYGKIESSTFYDNYRDIACFEKNKGKGGGKADVLNSIFYNSINSAFYVDSLSSISFNNSISNTTNLPGKNSFCEPDFKNAGINDFSIKDLSKCFGSDIDSKENIGASLNVNHNKYVIINEIKYGDAKSKNSQNWVELYNYSEDTINISGWIFKDMNDKKSYVLPENVYIKPEDYFVICNNIKEFQKNFPAIKNYVGDFDFNLNNDNEILRLFDKEYNLVNSFAYKNKSPWPIEDAVKGKTIELINPKEDSSQGSNWKFSKQIGGTPGKSNS